MLLQVLGAEEITAARLPALILDGVTFKWIVAICDTPLIYAVVWFLRRRVGLREESEARVDRASAAALPT